MNWNYNAQDYDPNKTIGLTKLIPIGDHRCRIKAVEETTTKTPPARDMIVLELEISGYEKTLKHFVVLDPSEPQKTNQKLGEIFTGFGIPHGNMNTASWVGAAGGCRVRHESYTGNDGKTYQGARIAYILQPDKVAALPAWVSVATNASPAPAMPATAVPGMAAPAMPMMGVPMMQPPQQAYPAAPTPAATGLPVPPAYSPTEASVVGALPY